MGFTRPVDALYPVQARYREKGSHYHWSVDPDNGLWIPTQRDGQGEHRGTDFACPAGTVIRAMADGLIIRSRFESALDPQSGAGLFITQLVSLMGHDSWVLMYSHLKASFVYPGHAVKQGQAIAESGVKLHTDLMNLKHQWKEISFC